MAPARQPLAQILKALVRQITVTLAHFRDGLIESHNGIVKIGDHRTCEIRASVQGAVGQDLGIDDGKLKRFDYADKRPWYLDVCRSRYRRARRS